MKPVFCWRVITGRSSGENALLIDIRDIPRDAEWIKNQTSGLWAEEVDSEKDRPALEKSVQATHSSRSSEDGRRQAFLSAFLVSALHYIWNIKIRSF